MTREKLQEINNCEFKIRKMVGLIEVINSNSFTNERVANEIMQNPDIFTEVKKFALELAQTQLSKYEEEFQKL
jgi:hypothetical protein